MNLFAPNSANIYSAGIEVHGVNSKAISSMKRGGIDISSYTSNNVDEYRDVNFDYIITVCDNANENCPIINSDAIKFHHNFPDPAILIGEESKINEGFDEVREAIKAFCQSFVSAYL